MEDQIPVEMKFSLNLMWIDTISTLPDLIPGPPSFMKLPPFFYQQYTCLLFVEVLQKHKMRAKPALQRAIPRTLSGIADSFSPKYAQKYGLNEERRPKMTQSRALMLCLGAPVPWCSLAKAHMRMGILSLASGGSRPSWTCSAASVI